MPVDNTADAAEGMLRERGVRIDRARRGDRTAVAVRVNYDSSTLMTYRVVCCGDVVGAETPVLADF